MPQYFTIESIISPNNAGISDKFRWNIAKFRWNIAKFRWNIAKFCWNFQNSAGILLNPF